MNAATTSGRLCIVACAVLISCMLLRPQLASALVTRGDDLSFRGDNAHALSKYALAQRIDPQNFVAADRIAFLAVESHDRAWLERAIEMLSPAIDGARYRRDLVMDRALCYQRLGQYALAARDFETSGRARRDPRALMFAALDERKFHRLKKARALLKEAIAIDPTFMPAQRALHRSATWAW